MLKKRPLWTAPPAEVPASARRYSTRGNLPRASGLSFKRIDRQFGVTVAATAPLLESAHRSLPAEQAMGRWRPPAPTSSPYITADGFDALQRELDELWPRRREVVKALAAAAAEGDRSENAEYIYRKKELAGLDRRIRYLQKRLPALRIVSEFANTDSVYFGATVDLEDEQGAAFRYRIVGPDEADARRQSISLDSALARALLGKRVDDEVRVETGAKTRCLTVIAVEYPPGSS